MRKDKIWNRNWLSFQVMAIFIFTVRFFLFRDETGQHEVYRKNSRNLKSGIKGYEAESNFFNLVFLADYIFAIVSVSLIFMASVVTQIVSPHEYIASQYIIYAGLIPLSLTCLHSVKAFNIQILEFRKIPYRRINRFWYEIRNADLLVPGFVAFLVIFFTFIGN